MDEEQRKNAIPVLDECLDNVREIKSTLSNMYERHQLWQDKTSPAAEKVSNAVNGAFLLAKRLREASDALKELGCEYVRACIVSWYRGMHWDIHPRRELPEEEITNPIIEEVTYQGNNVFVIRMTTTTHGTERVTVHSNGVNYCDIYSVDYIGG